MSDLRQLWIYLAASPLLHLTLTLIAFQIGNAVHQKFKGNPLLNPVFLAVMIILTVLLATRTSYAEYFTGAQFVHFLLGPATVALAIPLYRQFEAVRKSMLAVSASILSGSLMAAVSAVSIAWAMDGGRDTLLALAPKSVTAPVAMAITRELGGLPSLTAALVILTGITGAMLGPVVLNLMGIKDWQARGLAMGTASHGIGTARAMQVNEVAGAFSGLAMGMNALATAIWLPLLWKLLFGS
jgi:predicted murein hydrolase (TIGR00659 family)